MSPVLIVLVVAVAVAVAVGSVAAKMFGVAFPKIMLALGGLGVAGSLAWAAIEYQRVGDGPSCSVCVVSPQMAVALIAATGVGAGLLVALVGAATWGITAFRSRDRERRPDAS
jgi:hypothetical protein